MRAGEVAGSVDGGNGAGTIKLMNGLYLRGACDLVIGLVIAALALHTWAMMGLIVPIAVSGSSMAPALLGPHRLYHCADCRREFAVGLDQLPPADRAVCPDCGRREAVAIETINRRGDRLVIDRSAFAWREPRRWDPVVFRCAGRGGELCVKRVVGLPGETVSLAGGDVWVGGRIVRKSLAEQRALRRLMDAANEEVKESVLRSGDIEFNAPPRWRLGPGGRAEYRHFDNGPITDESSYNQGATPPVNRVPDIMLTFEARFVGDGTVNLTAATGVGEFAATIDFDRRQVALRLGDRARYDRPLPNALTTGDRFAEWTFSLFDRQALLAIDDDVLLAEPVPVDQVSRRPRPDHPLFSIDARAMSGKIHSLAVWRDVFYAVRNGDGRHANAIRQETTAGATAAWHLGPAEYFCLGDNAPISDDSRSWLSGPGVAAKLLIGKPLGIR
jgi:signal peptidase I